MAIALARLAAATAHIEAEAARRIAARLRLLRARKQRANVVPQADIRRGIRTRSATDGALVDINDLIERLIARELAVFARAMARVIDAVRERRRKRVGDKRAFARPRNARDHGKRAKFNGNGHILQVVLASAGELDGAAFGLAANLRHLDTATARQVIGREAPLGARHFIGRARGNHMAALLARTRAHINNVVGMANGVFVMLHDDNRVAQIAQAFKRGDKALVVALMQTDGRLVQDVQHAHEASANLRGQANALGFAA